MSAKKCILDKCWSLNLKANYKKEELYRIINFLSLQLFIIYAFYNKYYNVLGVPKKFRFEEYFVFLITTLKRISLLGHLV